MATTEYEPSDELVPYEPPAPITLFGTSDPRVALERMSEIAKVLVDLVRSQGLSVRIRSGEHLRVEAWRALGGMVGVHPVTAWSRPNESGDGFLVRVEARTRAGELVGASEAECSRAERAWKDRDSHALRAMAETRATSRAFRGPLGQIVVLAGYSPAAAEEMAADAVTITREDGRGPIPPENRPTDAQTAEVKSLLELLGKLDSEEDWRARCFEITGAPWSHMTEGLADQLIRRLQQHAEELMDEHEPGDAA